MLLATAFATAPAASAAGLGRGLIPFVAAVAAWHAAERRTGARAVALLLISGSVFALLGVVRFVIAGGRFPARAIGLTGTWMTFGLQLMLLASLGIGIALATRGRWRVGGLVAATAAGLGVATSYTRAAWIGMAVALAMLLGLRRPKVLLGLIVVAVLGYFTLPGDFGDRLRSAFDAGHPVNRERTLMWDAGLRAFRERPVTGYGLQSLRPVLEAHRSPLAAEHPAHVHDSYLQVALTTGLIGLAAFVALCAAALRAAMPPVTAWRSGTGLAAGVRAGVAAGVVGFLVAALFDHAFGDQPLAFLLFTSTGIAWAARRWDEDAAGPGAGR
jgi:O-antigen ligase